MPVPNIDKTLSDRMAVIKAREALPGRHHQASRVRKGRPRQHQSAVWQKAKRSHHS